MTLFHRYVYLPSRFEKYPLTILTNFYFTDHALQALVDDDLQVFDELIFSGRNILEVELDKSDKLKYLLLEIPIDYINNMCVALSFGHYSGQISVKTVYINRNDSMSELNQTNNKYYKPINMTFENER